MRRPLLSIGACVAGSLLCGQSLTDTVLLRAVEVVAPRITATPGTKLVVMDSAALAHHGFSDLGRLLTEETPVFVKSYGPGGLATAAFRGGSAFHTAVLWNGFNIGSPMNGQLDLSLLPVQVANSIAVQYGGSTALWGSGAVGGAVLLHALPFFNDGLRVDAGLSIGSFADLRQRVRVQRSGRRLSVGLAAYNATADNDLTLPRNTAGDGPDQHRADAAFLQRGLLGDVHVRLTDRQRLGTHAWYQESDRRIPPTTVEPPGSARQLDQSLRLTADWQRTGDRATTSARVAWFDERLDWYAADGAAPALNRSRTLIAEAETRLQPARRHHVHLGLNGTYARAAADGYPQEPRQDRIALFAAYRYTSGNEHLVASASARQEVLDGHAVPFTFSLGAEQVVLRWLTLKAQASKVYRTPSFNDLHWQPGGNPDLRSEQGYSGDLGAVLHRTWRSLTVRSEVTWFNRLIDDWIQWTPGPAYWSPRNLMQVWSRGVETNTTANFHLGRLGVQLAVLTDHVVSTNRIRTSANDASVDKQLIYVPMYSGRGRLGLNYQRYSLTGTLSYTGYRYTSTDNRAYLEPYWLANVRFAYRPPPLKRCTFSIEARCNNILNTVYEAMLNRPMPMRNYQLGVSMQFHRPSKP